MIDSVSYRAVKVTIWNDPEFFTLSDDGQLVWFHLYTNSMTNGLGMYHATLEGLAANKRWSLERYTKGFGEGLAKGLFEYDKTFQVIYFPNFIKHNKPANPNVLKGLLRAWDYIPESPLKARLHGDLKGLGEPFAKVMANVPVNVTPKELETIPETVTVTETVNIPVGASTPPNGASPPSVWDIWIGIVGDKPANRSFLGKQIKLHGEESVAKAVASLSTRQPQPANPPEFLVGMLRAEHPEPQQELID